MRRINKIKALLAESRCRGRSTRRVSCRKARQMTSLALVGYLGSFLKAYQAASPAESRRWIRKFQASAANLKRRVVALDKCTTGNPCCPPSTQKGFERACRPITFNGGGAISIVGPDATGARGSITFDLYRMAFGAGNRPW